MHYIVRDLGRYFKVIGLKGILKIDNKKECYTVDLDKEDRDKGIIKYSEASNYLLPEDYKKWQKKRSL
jgi:hypothetical protein